jgi:hypothetical protein
MDDPTSVRMHQCISDLYPVADDICSWQAAFSYQTAQWLPVDQLHNHINLIVNFANVVNGADVRVV